jgi:thioredoxin 1
MGIFERLFRRPPKPGKPLKLTDKTFNEYITKAKIPVVIDFWSLRCAPCQVMSGLLSEIGPEYAGQVQIYKLNVDDNPATAARFGIKSVPTVVFIKRGKVVDNFVGLLPLMPLKQKFDEFLRRR